MYTRRSFLGLLGTAAVAGLSSTGVAEAAALQVVGGTLNISSGLTGNTRKVALAARPAAAGGGYLAAFEVDTGVVFDPSYARFFNAGMTLIGSSKPLAKTTFSGTDAAAITVNPDGSSSFFFYGFTQTSTDLWWLQRFSAAGMPIGTPIRLGVYAIGDRIRAARMANGNSLVAWNASSTRQGRVVTPAGAVVASNQGTLCDGNVIDVAALPGGGAVVAYYGPDLKASFQRLNSTAGRVGLPTAVDAAFSFGGMTVAAHPLGFVGVWKWIDPAGNPWVCGAIFNTAGGIVARFPNQALRPADKYRNLYPVATSLPDGRVVVVVDSVYKPDPSASLRHYQMLGYLFGPNGTRLAPRQTLYTRSASAELWDYLARPRSLIRLADGTFLLGADGGYEFGTQWAMGVRFRIV
jgi:hypothetical protein